MKTPKSCGVWDVKRLRVPKPGSHKGDNGRLLVIAGSSAYHGSLALAVSIASRFCDIVYFHSHAQNRECVSNLRKSVAEVIFVSLNKVKMGLKNKKFDAVVIGPGCVSNSRTKSLLALVLKSKIPCVIDAGAFGVLDKNLLHKACVLTPHAGEFKRLFGMTASAKNAVVVARKFGCVILLKGLVDTIASPTSWKACSGGNAGLTKGGTGDVLAGLCGALLSNHNNAFLSACSSAFLLKKTSELLFETHNLAFNASDVSSKIPLSFSESVKNGR